jgi:RNA polymerase sigma-70 factor (ECF subfamily)
LAAYPRPAHHRPRRRPGRGGAHWAPDNPEAAGRAQRILAELPERYRRILELRFLHACSIKEAAAEMGVSVANAKVLQYRALRQAAAADERLAP